MAVDRKQLLEHEARLAGQLRQVREVLGIPIGEWTVKTQKDVAKFYGVRPVTVAAWAKAGMPGGRGGWPLDQIAQWLRNDGPWRPWTREEGDEGRPSDSPALEQIRAYKAKQAELDYRERIGELISRESVVRLFAAWGHILRQASGILRAHHGSGAEEVLKSAIRNCERAVDTELGNSSSEAKHPGGNGA